MLKLALGYIEGEKDMLELILCFILLRPPIHVLLSNFSPGRRILNEKGEKKLTAYLIHSLPLLMSAVQIFCGLVPPFDTCHLTLAGTGWRWWRTSSVSTSSATRRSWG
jgi:hypothetical protein